LENKIGEDKTPSSDKIGNIFIKLKETTLIISKDTGKWKKRR
jgi:hypothetical protein